MENLPYELIETFLKYIAENNRIDMIGMTKTMSVFHYLLKITMILRTIDERDIPETLCITKLKIYDRYWIKKNQSLFKSLISIECHSINTCQLPRIKNIKVHDICQLPHRFNILSTRSTDLQIKQLKSLCITNTTATSRLPSGLLYLNISHCLMNSRYCVPETVKILVIGSTTNNKLPNLPESVTKLSLFSTYNNYVKIITSNVRVLKCILTDKRHIFPDFTQFVNVTCLILGKDFSGIPSLDLKFPPYLMKFVIDIICQINLDYLPETVTSLHLHNLKNTNYLLSDNIRHASIVSTYCVYCHTSDTLSSLSITCRTLRQFPVSLRKLQIDNLYDLHYDLGELVNLQSLTVFSKHYVDYNIDKLEKLKYLKINTDTIPRVMIKLPINLMYFVINQNCVYDHIPKTLKYFSGPFKSTLPLKKPKYVILT